MKISHGRSTPTGANLYLTPERRWILTMSLVSRTWVVFLSFQCSWFIIHLIIFNGLFLGQGGNGERGRGRDSGGCEGKALRGEGVSGDVNQLLGWEDDRRERGVLSMDGEGPDAKANDSADESRLQNSRKEERKKRKERLSLEVRKEARSKRDTFLSIL